MGKRRKTLKEKKLSDLRHVTSSTTSDSIKENQKISASSFPSYSFSGQTATVHHQSFNLRHELLKTCGVSLGIVVFQVTLFVLFKNHIVLPFGPLQY